MNATDRESRNAYQRKWRSENRDKVREYQRAWLQKDGVREWVREYDRLYKQRMRRRNAAS